MKNNIYILIFVALISSCNSKPGYTPKVDDVIEINISNTEKDFDISKVANLSVLFLPTADSLLINEINRVHNTKEFVYLSDASAVYKFSYDGEFVDKIEKQGEGPGEYLNITDFQVDGNDNIWILCRNSKKMGLYSWDDELIRQIKLDVWVENIRFHNGSMLLYTGNEAENSNNCQIHFVDLQSGQHVADCKPIDKAQADYLFVKNKNLFHAGSGNALFFSQMFNDSIYSIEDKNIRAKYVCKWAEKNIPRELYDKKYANVMEFFQELHQYDYAYGLNFFLENKSNRWISYFMNHECYFSVISNDKSSQFTFSTFKAPDSLGDFVVNLSDTECFSQNDGSLIIPIDAMKVKDTYGKDGKMKDGGWEQVTEDSNPILLHIKPL